MSHLGVFDRNHTLWWDFRNPSVTWNTLIGGIRRTYQADVSSNEGIKGRNAYYLIWKLWSLAVLALVVKGLTPKLKFVMVYCKIVSSKFILIDQSLKYWSPTILCAFCFLLLILSGRGCGCGWTFERRVLDLKIHNNVTFVCLLQVLLK